MLMFRLYFMVNFVNMRKNFPDEQKLSAQQCRHADEVFGTLARICGVFVENHLYNAHIFVILPVFVILCRIKALMNFSVNRSVTL